VSETKSGVTTDLYYSASWQVLEERVGGNATVQYTWSPVYVDALIVRDRDTDANGSLDERLWVQQDANFNVTALVNGSGVVVERFAYDAFGNFTMYDASWTLRGGGSAYGWLHYHQGLRYDATVSLYDNRWRWYDADLGRFTSNDPLRFGAGDVNLVRYVGNNAPTRIDSMGLIAFPSCGPDVTDWLKTEVRNAVLFTFIASLLYRASWPGYRANYADQASWELSRSVFLFLMLMRVGNTLTDYKRRMDKDGKYFPFPQHFDSKSCGRATPFTVTLCGRCVGTNQLGNFMYGVWAALLGQVKDARSFGRDSGLVAILGKIAGITNQSPWSADGSDPREHAFNAGVDLVFYIMGGDPRGMLWPLDPGRHAEIPDGTEERLKSFDICAFLNKNAISMYQQHRNMVPCAVPYLGPATDIIRHKRSLQIDDGGNVTGK